NAMDHAGGAIDKNYAIYSAAPSTSFTNLNYNDYFANGPQGVLGYIGAADKTTLAAWQAATLQDANSLNLDPLFISTTDLDIDPASLMIGAGTPIAGIDYDFANSDRSNTIPTIGAYEGVLPSCPMPSALNADNLTPYSANLTWTPDGDETAWEYVYGLSPLPVPVAAGTATNSNLNNPVSGLSESTTYQYYVRAFCDPEFSDWAGPYTFVTPNSCPPPSGLSTGIISTTSAEINWIPGGDESSWNVQVGLPGFTPGTNTEVAGVNATQTHPWTASPLANSTQYQAYVQANCGFEQPKRENFWFEIDEFEEMAPYPSSGGEPVNEPGEDGQWYIYDQAPGEQDWYNIWFYDDPYDPARMKIIRMGFWVKRLNQDAPADISYVVNWSLPGWNPAYPAFPNSMQEEYIARSPLNGPIDVLYDSESPNGQWMELYYVISDYNPAWVSIDVWGQNVTVAFEEIAPPVESPLFEWWQQDQQRGGILLHECLPKPMGDASLWTGPLAFQTLCGPHALPLTQNFDGVTAPDLPYCWSKKVTTTAAGNVVTSTTYANSTPNSVRLYTDNDAAATLLLISPEVSASYPMSGNQVVFSARGTSTGYNVVVGIMTDPDDAATFTPVSTVTLTTTFTQYVIELGGYIGTGQYLAFKHGTASTYTSIYIDDVIIEPIPTCHKPTSLVSSNITQTSADLSWTAGEEGESAWEVKYGPVGFNPVTQGTKVTGIGLPLPYTLSPPLAPNTPYQWYVRGICGVGDTSLWAGPGSFTTLVSPSITYTPLPNTPSTGNMSLNATIIGAGGVPQTGDGLPRVCWKEGKNGSWDYVTGSYVSGNQYNFLFGSGAAGDTIFYFLVAQDNVTPVPNVLASPSAGAGLYGHTPPSAGTPPTTPNSYRILSAFSGILTVGADPLDDYSSLSGADGLFNALNNGIIIGPVHVQITSNLSETGTTALNALNYHIDSFFDVFFELPPSGGRAAVLISGNYAGGLIRLNGADHVTFDGGLAKELTFRNNSTSSSAAVFQLSNGASYNTIKNCNIGAGSNTATTTGINFLAAVGNDHNTLTGNNIFKAYYGINLPGSSTTDNTDNLIKNNLIGSEVDTLRVTVYGIYASYQTNFEISGNEIKNLIYSSVPTGISVSYCNNMVIKNNYIHDIVYTGTGGYGAGGIYVMADEGTVNNPVISIHNNVIRHITGDCDISTYPAWVAGGIKIEGSASVTSGIDIYYNSVYLTRDELYGMGYENNTWSAALIIDAPGPTGINCMNNSFYNDLGKRTSSSYTVYSSAIWLIG
ncbi:MAG: hypothetical protein HGA23_01470, partial [Bacteroidales bacterium]|nr:hypothetical protein [Bacteroidales bacterium]